MTIDINARNRIYEERKLKQIVSSLQKSTEMKEYLKPLENFSTKGLENAFTSLGDKLDKQSVLLLFIIGHLKKMGDKK